MKSIAGGVCAAKGWKAGGIRCGIRKNRTKKDLAFILSDVPASAAAVYTTNLVKGAPCDVTKAHLANGMAQGVMCNSGNANTCNANGIEIAEQMCSLASKTFGVDAQDILVASTGVIGEPLNIDPIAGAMDELATAISYEGGDSAAEAIMTTDTKSKQVAVEFEIGGKTCRLGGMAKGSGMIHPNMATMLVFITSDVDISPELLQKAISTDVTDTFNMLSVDGDTSTNDMCVVMANGLAGNKKIVEEDEDYAIFMKALNSLNVKLSRMIVGDGEGATKLLECVVSGAKDRDTARTVARGVICSALVKTAMFGADANWGRILCAIGYSGADVDVSKIDLALSSCKGTVELCKNGAGIPFSEEKAKEILLEEEIDILIELNDGDVKATAWGCDLTYDYVKINGDYRT